MIALKIQGASFRGGVMKLVSLCFLPLIFCGFCAVSSAQDVSEPYSTLNGNWHLTGAWAEKPHQAINLTLGMDGNTIYSEAKFDLSCISAGAPASVGWDVFLEGQVAPDGSFILSNPFGRRSVPAGIISIRGKIPAPGATEWSGTFNVAPFPKTKTAAECRAVSGDFVAEQFPPLEWRV
jgi:hypothetical protein